MRYSDFLNSIESKSSLTIEMIGNVAKIAACEIETSLPQLMYLLEIGYDSVEWIDSDEPCDICEALDGKTWTLLEFIQDLQHEAPLYEHAHCGCRCFIVVRNSKDIDAMQVILEATKMV